MNVLTRVHAVADSLGVPPWAVAVAAVVAVAVAVATVVFLLRLVGRVVTRAVEKARTDDDHAARARVMAMIDDRWRTIVGICGMTVSMYGLWGFAEETAGLPVLLRVFFIAIFDGAEIGLMLGLARSLAAQEQPRWTEGMRRSRRMAWGLATISAAANWVHAPEGGGLWAKVALAGVPIVSVKLLEHGLDLRIAELVQAEEEEGVRPGPLRLVVLLWRKVWIALFAWLGLDAASTTNETSRRLLAQRASRAVIELGQAQERAARSHRFRWTKALAERRERNLTTEAALALDRADAPVDLDQALAVVRRTMSHMQAGQLGKLDYSNADEVVSAVVSLPALQTLVQRRLDEQKAEVREEMRAAERKAEQARDTALADLDAERKERERIEAEREEDRARFERLAEEMREQIKGVKQERDEAKQSAAEQLRALREDIEQRNKQGADDRRAERETNERRAEQEAERWSGLVEQLRADAKQQLTAQAEQLRAEAAEQLTAERKRFAEETERNRREAERRAAEQAEQLRAEADRVKREAVEQAKREAAEQLAAERAGAEQSLAAERKKAERLTAELEAERAKDAEPKQEQVKRTEQEKPAGTPSGAAAETKTAAPVAGSLKERFIARVHELCEQGDARLMGEQGSEQAAKRARTAVAYEVQKEVGLGSQGTARAYMNDAMELWESKVKVPAPRDEKKASQGASDGIVRDTFGRPVADLNQVDASKKLLGV
ncbi:hypothetical protein [Streptomyces sp. NPDC002172]